MNFATSSKRRRQILIYVKKFRKRDVSLASNQFDFGAGMDYDPDIGFLNGTFTGGQQPVRVFLLKSN